MAMQRISLFAGLAGLLGLDFAAAVQQAMVAGQADASAAYEASSGASGSKVRQVLAARNAQQQQLDQQHATSFLRRGASGGGASQGAAVPPSTEKRWQVNFPAVPWELTEPPAGSPGLISDMIVPSGYDVAGELTEAFAARLEDDFQDHIISSLYPCNVSVVETAAGQATAVGGAGASGAAVPFPEAPGKAKPAGGLPVVGGGIGGAIGAIEDASQAASTAAATAAQGARTAAEEAADAAKIAGRAAKEAAEGWSRKAAFGFEGVRGARVIVGVPPEYVPGMAGGVPLDADYGGYGQARATVVGEGEEVRAKSSQQAAAAVMSAGDQVFAKQATGEGAESSSAAATVPGATGSLSDLPQAAVGDEVPSF